MADDTLQVGTTAQQEDPKGQSTSSEEPKTFTQEQVEAMIQERLNRDRHSSGYFELKEKAEKFDKLQEEGQSELEKAIARAEKAESKLVTLENTQQIAAWKQEVADETGVKASLLSGTTKEEIEQHARAIQEAYQAPSAPVVLGEGKKPAPTGKSNKEQFDDAIEQLW